MRNKQTRRPRFVRPKLRSTVLTYDLSLATELCNSVHVTPEKVAAVTLPKLKFMEKADAKQNRKTA